MLKIFLLSLFFLLTYSQTVQFPESSNNRDPSELSNELRLFREQQRKYLDDNNLFNSSDLIKGGFLGNMYRNSSFGSNREELEERLEFIKNSVPMGMGIKCYENKEDCQNIGGCRDENDCIPCMNWESKKPGLRCLKRNEESRP